MENLVKYPISITHFGITITINKIERNKTISYYDAIKLRTEINFIISNKSNSIFRHSLHNFQMVDTELFSYDGSLLITNDSYSYGRSFEIQPNAKYKGICQFNELENNLFVKEIVYRREIPSIPFSFRFYLEDYIPTSNHDLYKNCACKINKLYDIAETYPTKNFYDFESELLYAKKEAEDAIKILPVENQNDYALRLDIVYAEIQSYINTQQNNKRYSTRHSAKSFSQERIVEYGKREDLGDTEFRSSWEANIARILNRNKIKWQYEKQHFQLGDTLYLPDFFLSDGTILEVKGFWDNDSITKCDMFIRSYPEINYLIVDADMYYDINSIYNKYSPLPYWENSIVSKRSEPVAVVGISFLQDKSVLDELKIGTTLELEMESDNEYDKFAIAVKTHDGKYVGHIEKKFASIYTQKMKLGMTFNAEIESMGKKVIKVKVKRTNYDSFCIVYDILKNKTRPTDWQGD